MSDDDFDAFERAPCGLAVLAPDGVFVRVNARLLSWSGYGAEDVVGKLRLIDLLTVAGPMFFFTHVEPLLRMQGHVDEISATMKGRDGVRTPVYLNFELAGTTPEKILVSVFRGRDRAAYESELRQAKQRAEHLSAIVLSSRDAILSIDAAKRVLTANPQVEPLFGVEPTACVGRNVCQILGHPEGWPQFDEVVERALRGEHAGLEDNRDSSGGRIDFALYLSPIKNDDGAVAAVSVMCRDVTEQKRANEHVKLLMNEVNHRSKNLLAVVQGVARRTARGAPDLDAFMEVFTARLGAIAASQDLLVSGEWRGTQLHDLVRAQLAHLGGGADGRLNISGPAIVVSPRAAEAIGLALHELATNAAKHGALSGETGAVSISWSQDHGLFSMSWRESGGPLVAAPTRHGFGSIVLGTMAPQAIHGTGTLTYDAIGVRYELAAPAAEIIA